MKVSIVASECSPFFKTGGLADVIGSLPEAISKLDCEVEVLLPLFHSQVPLELSYVQTFLTTVKWRTNECSIYEWKQHNVRYLFFEHDDYFKRDHLYGYNDEAERFIFFTHAIIQYYLLCERKPTIVHCHDWQTGLLPLYLKQHNTLKRIKSVFTIHNLRYQGIFPSSIYNELLELPKELYSTVEMDGNISFLKTAIVEANYLTTVSPTYVNQIQTTEEGFGLDKLLSSRRQTLCGIVNGLDQISYQPASDQSLVYAKDPSLDMKQINKRAIQIELNLKVDNEIPLFAFISRLVPDKGVPLLLEAISKVTFPYQLAILGSGDSDLEQALLLKRAPHIAVEIGFYEERSRRLYAGADFLIMPSLKEPCGLNQLIAMRYGTVPIVHSVGGLKDTIVPYQPYLYEGNGLVFSNENANELANLLNEACSIYHLKEHFLQLRQNGLYTDSSWDQSAKAYYDLYHSLAMTEKRRPLWTH